MQNAKFKMQNSKCKRHTLPQHHGDNRKDGYPICADDQSTVFAFCILHFEF
jgi:hypothetical protein